MTTPYRNFAFISYSHRDMEVAKWLQKRLEGFRLPTQIHNDIEANSRYLRPIFRDQSDLSTGILSDELRRNLQESKFLILLCSTHSSHSKWVSDEARAFVEEGRLDHIIPLIIPHGDNNERELFPDYLKEYFTIHPQQELLGVNIGEIGKEKALIRIVSRMLNLSFDSLWKRHQRRRRLKAIIVTCATALTLSMAYLFALPVDVNVEIDVQQSSLPTKGDISLSVNGAEYTTPVASPRLDTVRIPGYHRFSNLRVTAEAQFFQPIDTVVDTGLGMTRHINLSLRRDDTFAIFAGTVYDDDISPLPNVSVRIGDFSCVTDDNGVFKIQLPLNQQQAEQPVTLTKAGFQSIQRDDETPGGQLKYIMHRE
ncbi:MAG: TIR domain-containing protein [Clostridiales bacterium]|nr:TIR domain-containing protein [Clostridiales bacterium]